MNFIDTFIESIVPNQGISHKNANANASNEPIEYRGANRYLATYAVARSLVLHFRKEPSEPSLEALFTAAGNAEPNLSRSAETLAGKSKRIDQTE